MTARSTSHFAAAIAAAAIAVATAGCTGVSTEPTAAAQSFAKSSTDVSDESVVGPPASDALVFVVSAHANVPAPSIPSELAGVLDAAIRAEVPLSIIAVDGTPSVAWSSGAYEISNDNPGARKADIDKVQSAVLTKVRGITADSDGSDLVQGLAIAQDQAAANGSLHPRIVVIDSGLPDLGALRMTTPGMTLADPGEVAAAAASAGSFPELTGASLTLVGFGYTAAPQAELSGPQRENVVDIWSAVLSGAGASVDVLPVPRSAAGPDISHTTGTVEPAADPELHLSAPTPAIFGEGSSLGFQPGLDVFRDKPASDATLDEIAAALEADADRTVHIMGTAAGTDTEQSQKDLSTRRAEAVARGLIARSIDPSRIETEGVGTQWPGYVYDVLPDGTLDPATAALNRTVQITFPTD